MLEIDEVEVVDQNLPDVDQAYLSALVRQFFYASHSILDLDDESDVLAWIREGFGLLYEQTDPRAVQLHFMLAIGAQSRGVGPRDHRFAVVCFSRAQRQAFQGMLRDPSIEMVRQFLLMALYMFGACRRNAAFMYLGIAGRAACALGLHLPECNRVLPPDEARTRSRVWRSLRVLDLTTTSILGRPPASSFAVSTTNIPHDAEPSSLEAMFDGCEILDGIVKSLADRDAIDTDIGQQNLINLRSWIRRLPEKFKIPGHETSPRTTMRQRDKALRSIYPSCLYYFAVITVTRPFLIAQLLNCLHGSNNTQSDHDKVADLAHVCVESASCLGKLCVSAADLGLLPESMCLIKVWMFTAALVLGFSRLTLALAAIDAEHVFDQIQSAMERYTAAVPQVSHYHQILYSFSDAINAYLRQTQDKRKHKIRRYMDDLDLSYTPGPGTSGADSDMNLSSAVNDDVIQGSIDFTDLTFPWDDFDFTDACFEGFP